MEHPLPRELTFAELAGTLGTERLRQVNQSRSLEGLTVQELRDWRNLLENSLNASRAFQYEMTNNCKLIKSEHPELFNLLNHLEEIMKTVQHTAISLALKGNDLEEDEILAKALELNADYRESLKTGWEALSEGLAHKNPSVRRTARWMEEHLQMALQGPVLAPPPSSPFQQG